MTVILYRISGHHIRWILPLFILCTLLSCNQDSNERELEQVKKNYTEQLMLGTQYQIEIRQQHIQIDSLKSAINHLEQQLAQSSPKAPALSQEEKEIRQMVHQMHKSWIDLVNNKNPQEILQYYFPSYIVNQVDINTNSQGRVVAYSEQSYPEFLEEIINRKDFSVSFGDVTFLDVEVKGGEFYNVAYKCQMKQYKKGLLREDSKVMVTITGRKITDNWKIGSYSVVTFEMSENL